MRKELKESLPVGRFDGVSAVRSAVMRSIRSTRNRSTEAALRMGLVRAGFSGWQVRPSGVAGNPDFIFPAEKIALFTDGCFWHACPRCWHAPIRSNAAYWERKAVLVREKDRRNSRKLRRAGWSVLRIWEHRLSHDVASVIERIGEALRRNEG